MGTPAPACEPAILANAARELVAADNQFNVPRGRMSEPVPAVAPTGNLPLM